MDQRRRQVVRRLLDQGLSPRLIIALLPRWERLVTAVVEEAEQAQAADPPGPGGDPLDQPTEGEYGEAGPVRFVIIDDYASLRDVLRRVAGDPRLDLIGEGSDGRVAAQLVERERPDAVVLSSRCRTWTASKRSDVSGRSTRRSGS